MANVRGTTGANERKYEEFVPPSGWTEDSQGHCLLVDLPGFKEEEVKLQVDTSGHAVTVKGVNQVNKYRYRFFEKTFKVPENSDMKKISAKFDGKIFYVIVPKQVIMDNFLTALAELEKRQLFPEKVTGTANGIGGVGEENKHDQELNNNKEETMKEDSKKNGHGDKKEKKESSDERQQGLHGKSISMLGNVMKEYFKNNKGIIIAVVLAFSLGVLVTHKFKSYGTVTVLCSLPSSSMAE